MNRKHKIISKTHVSDQNHQFEICFYDTFERVIFDPDNLKELDTIISFAKTQKKPFKWPLNLIGFQFLLGLFPNEKKVYIASKNLSYELNLIDIYQHLEKDDEIKDIINHAQVIAEIPLEDSPLVIDYLTHSTQYLH